MGQVYQATDTTLNRTSAVWISSTRCPCEAQKKPPWPASHRMGSGSCSARPNSPGCSSGCRWQVVRRSPSPRVSARMAQIGDPMTRSYRDPPRDCGLYPASGGNRTQLTTVVARPADRRPRFLPSGRAVLYSQASAQGERQVAVYDFDTGERRTLLLGTSPQFVSSGHLVFWRDNALWRCRLTLMR